MEDKDVAGYTTRWLEPLDVFAKDPRALQPTWPNTPQRERAFYVGAVWHAVGIHLVTGCAGILLAWRVQQLGL